MRWTGMSFALAALLAAVSGTASAGHPDLGDVLKGVGKVAKHGGDLGKALQRPGRDLGRVVERGFRDAGRVPRDGLRSLDRGLRGAGRIPADVLGPLGGALGRDLRDLNRGLGYPYDSRDRHHEEDSMARAYRDAAIANAVVGIVGIAATAAQSRTYAAPAGQWVREKVVIAPAHYETSQVWIPEMYDPRTGARSGGYYENRTRLVPEVCEYREVMIAGPGVAPY